MTPRSRAGWFAPDDVPGVLVSERELVAAAAAGDRDAFAVLVRGSHRRLLGFLLFRCDRQVAEDVAQQTYARALAAVGGYRHQGRPFYAWLVTIARNLLADYYRSGPRRSTVPLLDAADLPAELTPTCRPAEEEVLAELGRQREAKVLAGALGELEEHERQVLRLRFWEGLPVAQTAAALGVSSMAVKNVQARAVRALARHPAVRALRPGDLAGAGPSRRVSRPVVAAGAAGRDGSGCDPDAA